MNLATKEQAMGNKGFRHRKTLHQQARIADVARWSGVRKPLRCEHGY